MRVCVYIYDIHGQQIYFVYFDHINKINLIELYILIFFFKKIVSSISFYLTRIDLTHFLLKKIITGIFTKSISLTMFYMKL